MSYRFSEGGRLDREAAAEQLRLFLSRAVAAIGLDLRVSVETADPASADDPVEIRARFSGRDEDLILERNAELLQAIEYLAVRWLGLDPKLYDRVQIDAAGFRAARIEELKLSARIAAQRVAETGQPFRFNPMPARERRIVHLALADFPGIQSASEGAGDSRQVVISKATQLSSRPSRR